MAKHTGGCHCGAVRYEVQADIERAMECNCSLCSRTGWKLTFVPATQFQLLSGGEAVQDYQFGNKHLHHPFCRTCGVRAYSHGVDPDGNEMFAVNVRCLDDFDYTGVAIDQYDGAAI